ncbi:LysR substrate-binding domain-containing protein [Thioclava kandeliae]|uniref:LysR substrate-binding domain-containing protein n=1 Tax=Thioclava kandeliae TaxID=3070818 RepID=A0ABV1SMF6_9RHOB
MAYLSQRALEAFQIVLECGSVSGAAEIMNVSQPAVSRLIRDLEERTGLRLFTRFGGKIVPTPEAHELAIEVNRSFVGLTAIEKSARDIRLGRRSTVSIAAMPALAHSILADTLADLLPHQPDFRVTLNSMQTHNVIRQVASRQCQLGFTAPTRHAHDIDLIRNVHLPYVCLMPAGYPLAACDVIRFEDFVGHAVIGYHDTTATGVMMERAFSQMNTPPEVVVRSHLATLASQLVQRGLGVSVADPCTGRLHAAAGGVTRPFEARASFGFSIIRPRGTLLGRDLDAFDRQLATYMSATCTEMDTPLALPP